MSRTVANVDVLTETFSSWLTKTNVLTDALTNEIITANSTYANTGTPAAPRNAQLNGSFGANTLIATGALQGGSISGAANLNITSNVIVTGATSTSAANSLFSNTTYFTANVSSTGALLTVGSNVAINSTSTIIQGNNLQLNSNTLVSAIKISGNSISTNTTVGGTDFNIAANVAITGLVHTIAGNVNFDTATVFVDGVNNRLGVGTSGPVSTLDVVGSANVSGAVAIAGAASINNTLAAGNTSITGTVSVTGAANLQSSANVAGALKVAGAANLASTLGVTGAVTLSSTLAGGNTTVTGFANVSGLVTSNTLLVNNVATISGALTISNTVTQQVDYFTEVVSNTDIGISTSTPIKIYSFPIASYTVGKLMVKISATGNNQLTEMVVAHDGTTSFITAYGAVSSPSGASLGSFTTSINTGACELYVQQTITHSATKVVAQLIK